MAEAEIHMPAEVLNHGLGLLAAHVLRANVEDVRVAPGAVAVAGLRSGFTPARHGGGNRPAQRKDRRKGKRREHTHEYLRCRLVSRRQVLRRALR